MSIRLLARLVRSEWRGRRALGMALLVAVVAIATAGIVAGLQTQHRAASARDAAFAEANGAHVVVEADDAAVLTAIARNVQVASSTRPYRTLTDAQIDGDEVLVREVAAGDQPRIGRPLLRDGRWTASDDEIVLERSYALDRGLDVGDRVSLVHNGDTLLFTVVGRAVDLVDCFFPQCDPTPAWVEPEGFARLGASGTRDVEFVMFLRLHDPARADVFASGIGTSPDRVGVNTWTDTRSDALVVVGFLGAFVAGLGVFLALASAVVLASTMAGRVLARGRDIDVLSAVGCTPRQVTLALVATHALSASCGIVLGWLLGSALSAPLQLTIGEVLGGHGPSYRLPTLLVSGVVVEAIVLVSTVLPARQARRTATRGVRDRWHETRFGAVADRGVRESVSPLFRVAMVMLALTLAMLGIVVTVSVRRSVDRAIDEPALTGDPADISVVPAIEPLPNIGAQWTVVETRGAVDDQSFLVRGLDGDVANAGYVVREGRMFRGPGEAVAGYGLLGELGVTVGDDLDVELAGETMRVHIVGWYAESEDSGVVLQVPHNSLPVSTQRDSVSVTKIRLTPGADRAAAARAIADRTGARVIVHDASGTEDLDAFNLAFTIVASLVVAVALTNLVATLVLQARARAGQTAVLRAIGFRRRDVIGATLLATGLHTVTAIALAVPLGLLASAGIIDGIAADVGIGPGLAAAPAPAVIVAAGLALLAATLGLAAVVARRVTAPSISSLVRGE